MDSPLWMAAGWTMIHFLWVGGLIGLAAAAGRRALRRVGANVRYLFLLLCLAALLAAPAVIGRRMLSSERAGRAAALSSEREPAASAQRPGTSAGAGPTAQEHALAKPARAAVDGPPAARLDRRGGALSAIAACLPWLWLIGTPLTFSWALLGLCGAGGLRRRSRLPRDPRLDDVLSRIQSSLRGAGRLAVRLCDGIASPVLVGIVRPLVLLPPAALSGCSPEQVEMILLHELAHIRRWDNLANLLQRVVESLLFFHPAVWLVSSWARLESEVACDDSVLARTGKPLVYAEALARFALPARLPAGSAALSGSHTVERIRRILEPERHKLKLSRLWIAPAAGFLVLAFLACALLTAPGGSGSHSPFSFLRFHDRGDGTGGLEAAMAAYEGPGGAEVLLVTDFAYADAGYYERLKALFAECGAVLHETPRGVRAAGEERAQGLADRVLSFVWGMEEFVYMTFLNLDREESFIDRSGDKFIEASAALEAAADPAPEKTETPEPGESAARDNDLAYLFRCARNDLELFTRYLRNKWGGGRGGMESPPDAEAAQEVSTSLPEMDLKFLFAREFVVLCETAWPSAEDPLAVRRSVENPETWTDRRERAVLEEIRRLVGKGSGAGKIVIYFGPGMLSELEAALSTEPGFKKVRKDWLTAWEVSGE